MKRFILRAIGLSPAGDINLETITRVGHALHYVALTYVISFSIFFLYFVLDGSWEKPISQLIPLLYGFVPLITAILLRRSVTYYRVPSSSLSPRWFLMAWLLPVVLLFMTIGIGLLFPDVTISPDFEGAFVIFGYKLSSFEELLIILRAFETYIIHPLWIGIAEGLILGMTLYTLFYVGEEMGWRGLLYRTLRPIGGRFTILFTGLAWGIWLLPLVSVGHFYPHYPFYGSILIMVWAMVASPILFYLRDRSGSFYGSAIFRGTFEALLPISLSILHSGFEIVLIGGKGIAAIAAFVFIDVLVIREMRRCPPDTSGMTAKKKMQSPPKKRLRNTERQLQFP